MLVTQKKKVQKTLSLLNNPIALSRHSKKGESVTVIPEFLEFYLLLHAA
jgi:hypothetical protein